MTISANDLLDRLGLDAGEIGVCSHSSEVTSGDIFIALGEGVSYIQQALDNGAVAVICQLSPDIPEIFLQSDRVFQVEDIDRYITELLAMAYGSDLAGVDLIGITGTNGKTSSAHFSCQMFKLLGIKAGYIGTLGYGVIDGGLQQSRNTTPDRISLHRYVALLSRSGCKKIVMEVSSHAIVLGRIEGLEFDVGVFTNLSRDHLDFHLNMQSYEEAKLSFFSDYPIKHLVINVDDTVGEKLVMQRSGGRPEGLSSYGQEDRRLNDYLRYHISQGENCIHVFHRGAEYEFSFNVGGRFNIENMIAAALVCHASGYSFDQIADVTGLVGPVPGRLECTISSRESRVCVDYAHTPAGMATVLEDASLLPAGSSKVWCVFGCGGERDAGKRSAMGAAALRHSDHIIVTDDNVRGEQAETILCDIVSGVDDKKGLTICRDRGRAISYAMGAAVKNDLVLVLGKGDESFIDYGRDRLVHQDMDVVMQGAVH